MGSLIRYLSSFLLILLLSQNVFAAKDYCKRFPADTPIECYTPTNPPPSSGITSIATTAPITGGTITSTGTIACNVASGSQPGCLASADWTTFNSKFTLPSLTLGSVVFSDGTTLAQDNQSFYFNDTTNTLSLFPSLTSEILTNGTFTGSATGWTVPSGYAYSSNTVVHSSNGAGSLAQSTTPYRYREHILTYVISNWTVGTVTASIGGQTDIARSANGTYTFRFVPTSTTALSFKPSNTARFTIDTVSLKMLIGSSTLSNLNVGGLSVEGSWSNGTPNTTRAMTFNNDGSYTWTDYRFAGVLRGSFGANSSGGMDAYTSGGSGFAFFSGNSGLTSNSLYSFNYPSYFYHTGNVQIQGNGMFGGRVGAGTGSGTTPTSFLQVAGGTALKVKRVTASQSLDDTATQWLADATTASACSGTPSVTTCSTYLASGQATCEGHLPCVWNAGSSCSAFNSELGMGTCSGTSGCTADTSACSGGDQSTCEAGDDSYGGSCVWSATGDCSPFDEATCGSYSGQCTQNFGDCTPYSDGGGDGSACSGYNAGCSYDSGTGACTGTPYLNCTGNYNACSGTYYTGNCSGTYGTSCSGTATCTGYGSSGACGAEAGCTWSSVLNLTLPDGDTCQDRTYFVYNDSSGGADVVIYPYTTASPTTTVNNTTSYTLSEFTEGVQLSYYKKTYDCGNYATAGACTPTGCTINYSNCSWDSMGSTCSGNAVCTGLSDQVTCEAQQYFSSCSGTEVQSKNWYAYNIKKPSAVSSAVTLTSGRVPYITTGGVLTDDADLTFSTDTLTATKFIGTTSIGITAATASTIASFDGSKNIVSLATATYPSLTELSYVKGVTSAIQTQINAKGVGTVTSIATTAPITGGTITGTGTIAINDAAADATTKGASTYTAADFNASSGLISLDYTNGQAASASNKGFLTSADWTTFNNKAAALSGTTNTMAKFNSSTTIGNSALTDDGTSLTYLTSSGHVNSSYTYSGIGGIDASTQLMLNLNNNVTDTEIAGTPKTVTNTNVTFTNSSPHFSGSYYGVFNGTTAYLSTPYHSSLDIGTNWTMDVWVYPTDVSVAAGHTIYSQGQSGAPGYNAVFIGTQTNGDIGFLSFNGSTTDLRFYTATGQVTVNAWNHIVVQKAGTTWSVYVNGVSKALTLGTGSYSATIGAKTTGNLNIGRRVSAGDVYFVGNMGEFRWSNTNRYSGNFTPNTTAYTASVNYPSFRLLGSAAQTAKIWTDGGNSDRLTFTVASTNVMTQTTTNTSLNTTLTIAGLTSTRVPIAGTAGLLGDDADLTFLIDTLTSTNVSVSDAVYASGWNGSLLVPTRNAVYDKIEAIAPIQLFNTFADSTVGGAETDIFTYTTTAGRLAVNGEKIFASYSGNFVTVGTELTQLKAYFGGTEIWDSTGVAPTTGTTSWDVFVKLTRVSASIVRYTVLLTTTGATGFNYAKSGELTGLTLANTNILKVTGISTGVGSGSGDIVGKMSSGEFKPAA